MEIKEEPEQIGIENPLCKKTKERREISIEMERIGHKALLTLPTQERFPGLTYQIEIFDPEKLDFITATDALKAERKQVEDIVTKAACFNIFIDGEDGTGKTQTCRFIHSIDPVRKNNPLIFITSIALSLKIDEQLENFSLSFPGSTIVFENIHTLPLQIIKIIAYFIAASEDLAFGKKIKPRIICTGNRQYLQKLDVDSSFLDKLPKITLKIDTLEEIKKKEIEMLREQYKKLGQRPSLQELEEKSSKQTLELAHLFLKKLTQNDSPPLQFSPEILRRLGQLTYTNQIHGLKSLVTELYNQAKNDGKTVIEKIR